MKDIADKLREKRQEIGISTKEVSDDLKVDQVIIDNVEEGNSKVFKDILELREFVSNYAKYLGLDNDEIDEEMNDYLFEKTSKISLDDIKEAEKKTKLEEKKIKSPYTAEIKEKNKAVITVFVVVVIVLILILFYIVLRNIIIR